MDHQHFEEWLLADEPLSEAQQVALQEHLGSCDTCPPLLAAWQEVQFDIQSAGMVSPAEGFTARWQMRLEAAEQRQDKRQAWYLLLGNSVVAVGLLIAMGLRVLPEISSPTDLFLGLVDSVVSAFTFLEVVTRVGGTLLHTLPGVVPSSWIATVFTAMSALMILWIATLRQYALPQGVTK